MNSINAIGNHNLVLGALRNVVQVYEQTEIKIQNTQKVTGRQQKRL